MPQYISYGQSNSNLNRTFLELTSSDEYNFSPSDRGRELLRRRLRAMHGYKGTDSAGDIRYCTKNSPIARLLRGEDIRITNDGWILDHSKPVRAHKGQRVVSTIRGSEIRAKQRGIQIWYDPRKITTLQVQDIQNLKAGKRIKVPSGMSFQKYKLILESLASYVVIRGQVTQYFSPQGDTLNPPRARVLYYANFPKLQGRESIDLNTFCAMDRTERGKYTIIDPVGLKEKMKSVIRLQFQVAAANGDALSLVTPNAFFYALTNAQQVLAKQLFAKGVSEISQEPFAKGLSSLFVQATSGMQEELAKVKNTLTVPVTVGNGDASSPQLAMKRLGIITNVAESIMGDPVGPAGNGALGNRANKAKEENDSRMMSGEVQLVFGPQWNRGLLDPRNYQITTSEKRVLQQPINHHRVGVEEEILERKEQDPQDLQLASVSSGPNVLVGYQQRNHQAIDWQTEQLKQLELLGDEEEALAKAIQNSISPVLKINYL